MQNCIYYKRIGKICKQFLWYVTWINSVRNKIADLRIIKYSLPQDCLALRETKSDKYEPDEIEIKIVVVLLGFIKTTDPPTTYHLPTDLPTFYPPTYRLTIIKIVKIEDQLLNLFCTLYFLKTFRFSDFLLLLSNYYWAKK